MRRHYLPLILLAGLLNASLAHAQFAITHTASACVDPPELSIVVGSENDKKLYPECVKWSAFFGASEVFASDMFVRDDTTVPPVNLFAQAIIKSWTDA